MITPKKTKEVKKHKHAQPLLGCRFDPTGRFVFAGGQDNKIIRWEWQAGKTTELIGHKSWIRPLACDPKSKKLFSADFSGKILVWELEPPQPLSPEGRGEKKGAPEGRGETRPSPEGAGTKQSAPLSPRGRGVGGEGEAPIQTIDAHRGFIRAIKVSPDGALLASCGNDNLIRVWSTADGKHVRDFAGHQSHVYEVDFHPDGKRLASIDLKGNVHEWDIATAKKLRDMDAKVLYKYDPTFRADIGGAKGVCFNEDGSLWVCAGITNVSNAFAGVGNPLFVLFDWKTGKQKKLLKPSNNFRGSGWGVEMHPEGYVIGVGAGGGGGGLWFWKPDEEKSFHFVKLPTNARDLDLHPDQRHLAIPFADGHVRVYDLSPEGS